MTFSSNPCCKREEKREEEISLATSVILIFKRDILKWPNILLKQHLKILNLPLPEIFMSISQIP